MRSWIALVAVLSMVLATGCPPKSYEFLKMPRAGLKAGSRWKAPFGPITDGPPPGVVVTEKAQGLEWLEKKTKRKGGARLKALLGDFLAAGLEIDSSKVTSITAEGLTHRQVVDPEKLTRGYDYLWETVEASKVRITLDKSLASSIEGRIDKFAKSGLAAAAKLEFKATTAAKDAYEVTGKDLVVAVKVASFAVRSETKTVTLRLDKDFQDRDQPGPFGYTIAVKGERVDLPARSFEARLRNGQFSDVDVGSWECRLTTGDKKVHAGPVNGQKYDLAMDNVHVSRWNTQELSCDVTFTRTVWTLKQVGCGLETVK